MAAASPSVGFPPHPYLQSSTLFICPSSLPSHVLEEHVEAIFKDSYSNASVSFTRVKKGRNRGSLRARVDFPDLNSAEKGLAIHHLRPISSLEPPVVLTFSTNSRFKPLGVPDASISPRLIKTLSSEWTRGKLYDLLRPYGPICSIRIHPVAGGLVQFWDEAHAKEAETRLAAAQPKMILNSYDPCSLLCTNISFALDARALRTHFAEYGNIINAEIFTDARTGKSRGRGIITFSLASEASRALQAMHGAEIQWKVLSVTYWVVKTGENRRTAQPTKAFKEADSRTQKDDVSPVEMETPSEEPLGTTAATPEELHETTAPSEPPPAEAAAETNAGIPDLSPRNSELEALQTLYDTEMKHRIALQAENELLREELETMKRTLEMAESRLKILQLESDRPLWEAAKKKREENERAERAKEEERRRAAELEESRRKMREFQEQEKERKRAAEVAKEKERLRREAQEKARREKEERERKQREKEESERKARELREKLEREKRWRAATQAEEARCQKRDAELWGAGAWTPLRALERFKLQIEEFDKIKFSETQPLTFHAVPWPVLIDPLDLDIEEIDWKAVEAFFARVKVQLAANVAEYKSLVEKVHRMFHPDKWRSRGLLATVMDGDLKTSLETAGNVVAQAMTPLWRKSKGYTDT